MKGNTKKLAVLVIIAIIALLVMASMASAWWPVRAMWGKYAVTGFGQCLAAPLGFTNLIPNGPPGLWVIDTSSWEGVYIFRPDGTGVMKAIDRIIELQGPGIPNSTPTATSANVQWDFQYNVANDGRITFTSGTGAWKICFPGDKITATGDAPIYGFISPDGQTINVTLGPPEQLLTQVGAPTQLLCTVSNVLFKLSPDTTIDHKYPGCEMDED